MKKSSYYGFLGDREAIERDRQRLVQHQARLSNQLKLIRKRVRDETIACGLDGIPVDEVPRKVMSGWEHLVVHERPSVVRTEHGHFLHAVIDGYSLQIPLEA